MKNFSFTLAKKIEIHYYINCVSTLLRRVLIKKSTYNLRRLFHLIKPLGDRIIIELVESEEKTASGIVLPDTAKEKPQEGKVVAVGTGRVLENGERVALEVEVGNRIIFSKYAGTEVKYQGTEYLILRENDILAVVE
jgi:chaperonin GroES